jgi:TP901 family phage tail tape measure protein
MPDALLGVGIKDKTAAGKRSVINAFKSISRQAKSTTKDTESFAGALFGLSGGKMRGVTMGLIGKAGIVGAFAAVGAAAGKATRDALQFTTAVAELSTLLPKGSKEVDIMADQSKRLARQFGDMPINQTKAFYQIISAGASGAAEATNILTVSNKLAIGGVTDVRTAADGLTSTLNAYGLAAHDATMVSDAMFVAMRAGKTDIAQISASIGSVAPLAAQAGASIEELLSAVGALTKGGQSTNVAMTGVRAILASIVKPTSEASKMASDLGIEFTAAALESKGLAKFLQDVAEKTGGSSEKMAQLFGGVEALVPALALTGKGAKDFNDIMDSMKSKAGETEEAVEKMMSTPQKQLDKLTGRLATYSVSLGESILKTLTPSIAALNRMLDQYDALGLTSSDGLVRAPDAAQKRAEDALTGGSGSTKRSAVDISKMPTMADLIAEGKLEGQQGGMVRPSMPIGESSDPLLHAINDLVDTIQSKESSEASTRTMAGLTLRDEAINGNRFSPKEQVGNIDAELKILGDSFGDFSVDLSDMAPPLDKTKIGIDALNTGLTAIAQAAPSAAPFITSFQALIQGDYLGAATGAFIGVADALLGSTQAAEDFRQEMEATRAALSSGSSSAQSIIDELYSSDVSGSQSEVLKVFEDWFAFFQGGGYGNVKNNAEAVRELFDRVSRLDATGARALSADAKLFEIAGKNFAEFRTMIDEAFGTSSTFSSIAETFFNTSSAFDELRDSADGAAKAAVSLSDIEKAAAEARFGGEAIAAQKRLQESFVNAGSDNFAKRDAFTNYQSEIASILASMRTAGASGSSAGASGSANVSLSGGSASGSVGVSGPSSLNPSVGVSPQVTINRAEISTLQLVSLPSPDEWETFWSESMLSPVDAAAQRTLTQVMTNIAAHKTAVEPSAMFDIADESKFRAFWNLLGARATKDLDQSGAAGYGPVAAIKQVFANVKNEHDSRLITGSAMFQIDSAESFRSFWTALHQSIEKVHTDQGGGGYGPTAAIKQVFANVKNEHDSRLITGSAMFRIDSAESFRSFWTALHQSIEKVLTDQGGGGYGPTAAIKQVVANMNNERRLIEPSSLFAIKDASQFRSFWTEGLHNIITQSGEGGYGPVSAINKVQANVVANRWRMSPSDLVALPDQSTWNSHFMPMQAQIRTAIQFVVSTTQRVRVNAADFVEVDTSGVQDRIASIVQDAVDDRQFDTPFGTDQGYYNGRA